MSVSHGRGMNKACPLLALAALLLVATTGMAQPAGPTLVPDVPELHALRARLGPAVNISTLRAQPEYEAVLDAASRFADAPRWLPAGCGATSLTIDLPRNGTRNVAASSLDSASRCLLEQIAAGPPCARTPLSRVLRVSWAAEDRVEFGYELFQAVPDAYALCKLGVLHLQSVCKGSAPLFFFVGMSVRQARAPPCDRRAGSVSISSAQNYLRQHKRPVGDFWRRQPPFRAAFRLPVEGRLAYVFNKWSNQPGPQGKINSWSLPGLLKMLERLRHCYDHVVYFRAGAMTGVRKDLLGEAPESKLAYPDIDEIRRAVPSVLMLQDLIPHGPGNYLDRINTAQLVLTATADVTVGVQGGGAVLASLTADPMYFVCRSAHECSKDVGFWQLYNNATIVSSQSEQALSVMATLGCPAAGGGALHLFEQNLIFSRPRLASRFVADRPAIPRLASRAASGPCADEASEKWCTQRAAANRCGGGQETRVKCRKTCGLCAPAPLQAALPQGLPRVKAAGAALPVHL